MYKYNERETVKLGVALFLRQYANYDNSQPFKHRSKCNILRTLDLNTVTSREVCLIIGNDSWCGVPACHECFVQSWDMVQLGQEPDYESATANICLDCLKKAIALIEGANDDK